MGDIESERKGVRDDHPRQFGRRQLGGTHHQSFDPHLVDPAQSGLSLALCAERRISERCTIAGG
jgi:hypothetical protein